MKLIKKSLKINIDFPKRAKNCWIRTHLHTKIKRITFFFTKSFKKEKYLNLNKFNNRNAVTKTRFSSGDVAINTNKCYNL